jgi:hypothetical protein
VETPNFEMSVKQLLVFQRAKVGRFKLADFFVPQVGFEAATV